MAKRQFVETLGMTMIGEAVLGMFYPKKHLRLWQIGPRGYREAISRMARNSKAMRMAFLAEGIIGLWLARKQFSQA